MKKYLRFFYIFVTCYFSFLFQSKKLCFLNFIHDNKLKKSCESNESELIMYLFIIFVDENVDNIFEGISDLKNDIVLLFIDMFIVSNIASFEEDEETIFSLSYSFK